jgi:hypothetical protein
MGATTNLSTKAADGGTYIITCAFTDEDGVAVAPDTMVWSLTDADGVIINNRDDKEVASPTASQDVVLSGNDLLFTDGRMRIFTVEATYTSGAGVGLPLTGAARFFITNLLPVA